MTDSNQSVYQELANAAREEFKRTKVAKGTISDAQVREFNADMSEDLQPDLDNIRQNSKRAFEDSKLVALA